MTTTRKPTPLPFSVSGRDLKLNIESVKYNRNGIGGEGFYVVRFSMKRDNGTPVTLFATVYGTSDNVNDDNDTDSNYTAVFNPFDPEDNYRGADYFTDALRVAIRKARGY